MKHSIASRELTAYMAKLLGQDIFPHSLPERCIEVAQVIVPSDTRSNPIKRKGGGGFVRKRERIPRTLYVIETLQALGLQYDLYAGKNTATMMRKMTYLGFFVKSLNKLILVCDESSNLTFVVHNLDRPVESYFGMKKSQFLLTGTANYIKWQSSSGVVGYKTGLEMLLLDDELSRSKLHAMVERKSLLVDHAQVKISEVPHLEREYSPNNKKPASEVFAATTEMLLWTCGVCAYEWPAIGANRYNNGSGCPACMNYVVTATNNIVAVCPHLESEYSPKNAVKSPHDVFARTTKKLWWKCGTCRYKWRAKGVDRVVKGSGCPACANIVVTRRNNMSVTHPHLVPEYSSRNVKPVTRVIAGTNKKLWWKCSKETCGYEWEAKGTDRAFGRKSGCPACAGKVATPRNNMALTHPFLAEEYASRNSKPATEVLAGITRKVWWICRCCQHEWPAPGSNRVNGSGCPKCNKNKSKRLAPIQASDL